MTKVAKIKLTTALFCEDVRREDNGKLILIGMFGRNIGVPSFPASIGIQCALIIEVEKPGPSKLEFEIRFNGEPKGKGRGVAEHVETGRAILSTPFLMIGEIEESGTLSLAVAEEGQEFREIASIPIDGPPMQNDG